MKGQAAQVCAPLIPEAQPCKPSRLLQDITRWRWECLKIEGARTFQFRLNFEGFEHTFFYVLNHTVSVETHRKMKAAKNTSCATVVQQITSERLEGCLLLSIIVYYLSSKAPRPAPREHHEQRQVNLPRQVQVGGQELIFRCGKEEDPAMLSDYTMPIHIQRLNLRMTLHYA